ncbi:hypothetical protein MOQ72_42310 [Saccharopolyspora sp. K220]|uniref:hypothetical protein n=1 Tax=Saccharopolyspora soli TaxID=2926618 RepID=UPI001F568AC5|nr:hypothetical protein [Saccharopolyspora soli]MCI2424052.1 hypothetical protein [Saccharopolyspora soli]
MDESTAELQRLGRSGFVGAPIPDEDRLSPVALVYARWWSSGVVDVVTVLGEDEASAYRTSNQDLRRPEDLGDAVVRWRVTGTVIEVTAAVLELSSPPEGGVPISACPADRLAVTHGAGRLWTP